MVATTSPTLIKVRATTTPVYNPYDPNAYTGPKSYTYSVSSSGNNPITDADTYKSILASNIPAADDFVYADWRLTHIDSLAQSTSIGEDITILLSESAKTMTVMGCNTYKAKLTVSYNVLQSDLLASTYKTCDYFPRTIREGDFVRAIKEGAEYQLKDDNTLLIRTSNAKVYQFMKL
jgi:heat shock protein HslJ